MERVAALARLRAQEIAQTAASTHEITWRGSLVSTSLPGLRAGEPCVLTGEFSGVDASARLHGLSLRCGAVEVYRQIYAPPRIAEGLRRGAAHGSDARVLLFSFDDTDGDGRRVTISTMRRSLVITGRNDAGVGTTVSLRDVSDRQAE